MKKKGADAEISLCNDSIKYFVGETFGTTFLDSGCPKNVCRAVWLKCYFSTLHKEDTKTAQTFASNTNFRFRNRVCVKSVKFVKIPSLVGGRKVFIETDVVNGVLPLLLSKDAMKKHRCK